MRYYCAMIRGFANDETEKVFERRFSRSFSGDLQRAAYRKLLVLDAAEELGDLRSPPGNRLKALKGKRKGQHSVRINEQWRICFRWEDGDAFDVEIMDYH